MGKKKKAVLHPHMLQVQPKKEQKKKKKKKQKKNEKRQKNLGLGAWRRFDTKADSGERQMWGFLSLRLKFILMDSFLLAVPYSSLFSLPDY